MSEIVLQKEVTPLTLLERGASSGASIEQMAQLFELQLRYEANEAKKSFNASMAAFKKSPPQIGKNKHVKIPHKNDAGFTEYDHTTLDHACDMIVPALSALGIRHRWENKQGADGITVTCILSNEAGHEERTPLTAPPDQSGGKNSIQAIASTVTYLQRYTLLGACGMAAMNSDTDGALPDDSPRMKPEVLRDHLQYLEVAATLADARKFLKIGWDEAAAIGDAGAQQSLQKAYNERCAELKRELA